MIADDREVRVHAVRARIRRWVEEDDFVTPAVLVEEPDAVGTHEAMVARREAARPEVPLTPIEVRLREIDARRMRPGPRGDDARGAGVGEEIEQPLAARELGDASAQ